MRYIHTIALNTEQEEKLKKVRENTGLSMTKIIMVAVEYFYNKTDETKGKK